MATISSEELTEWMAFEVLEPFGAKADNLNAGLVASTLLNVNRKKGSKAIRPDEACFGTYKEIVQQSLEEQKMAAEHIARAFGAVPKKKDK